MNGPAVNALHAAGALANFAAAPLEPDLLVRCIAARLRRRQAWLETIGGDALADSMAGEHHWQVTAGVRLTGDVTAADAALADLGTGGFDWLCRAFGLEPGEREILMTALALHLDPRLLAACQQVQARPWTTEALVARLFGHGLEPLWNPAGALAVWDLVRAGDAAPAEPPPLTIDPVLAFWLRGDAVLDAELAASAGPLDPPPPLASWPVATVAARIRGHGQRQHPVRLLIEGAPGAGRSSFAGAVAAALGRPALLVHAPPDDLPRARQWTLVQRHCRFTGAVPVWRAPHAPWPHGVPPVMLQAICVEHAGEAPPEPRAADLHVRLPAPGRGEREGLLRSLVPESNAWSAADRARLVDRPGVVVADLVRLERQGATSLASAEAELRTACAGRLGDQAERLETGFEWADLVLPAGLVEALRDFTFEAEQRTTFWEQAHVRRLFPGGRALVALLAGPPGTGKTMAAQIIARDLGVDLFRIDLAALMSKYIGETAKNLRQVFTRAAQMHAVLLFDEADALFARRTEVKDAHDRYANTDTNYLLQQLESFSGIALLASNRKTNMDGAFLRRIRYVFDFPRPDAPARRELWRRLSASVLQIDAAALGSALDRLGDELDLSGAQIKNALVAAHFAARRRGAGPALGDLLRGVERELAKEGRALAPRDHRRLGRHA